MSCECYKIGGPFISFDPSCPAHGYEAQEREAAREAASFNGWWEGLPEGRRAVLIDDKWALAQAAFNAGKEA